MSAVGYLCSLSIAARARPALRRSKGPTPPEKKCTNGSSSSGFPKASAEADRMAAGWGDRGPGPGAGALVFPLHVGCERGWDGVRSPGRGSGFPRLLKHGGEPAGSLVRIVK